jgi:hypothetical protein
MNIKRITEEQAKHYRSFNPSFTYNEIADQIVAFTLTPDIERGPGWEKVTYYGEKWNTNEYSQYVYILVNPSVPNICKIGFTTTSVYQRVKEINSATGVIIPWYSVYSYKCPDGRALEQEVHKSLEIRGLRVNNDREGFSVTTEDARILIEALGKKYQRDLET